LVTSLEIEELIVRLHKENKSYVHISKAVHKNFTYIGAVLRRRLPEEFVNIDNYKTISKETQALKLFKKGKDLVYVVTKLDIKPEDVRKLYLEYQSLQGLPSLKDMHNELGNSLPSFLQAYKKIVRSGIDIDKVILIAGILDQIPKIENQYNELRDNVQQLFQLKYTVTGEVNRLKNQIIPLQNYFNSLSYQYKVINARRGII
jgi:hypothetical protein